MSRFRRISLVIDLEGRKILGYQVSRLTSRRYVMLTLLPKLTSLKEETSLASAIDEMLEQEDRRLMLSLRRRELLLSQLAHELKIDRKPS